MALKIRKEVLRRLTFRLALTARRWKPKRFSSEARLTPGNEMVDRKVRKTAFWMQGMVWGLYGSISAAGAYLLASDIYRVCELSTRVEGMRESKTSALQDRLNFVNGTEEAGAGAAEYRGLYPSNDSRSKMAATLPGSVATLSGTYSDLPGRNKWLYLSKGNMKYRLRFAAQYQNQGIVSPLCSFEGEGEDAEGKFKVEDGVYNTATGRIAWGERSEPRPVRYMLGKEDFTLYAECRGDIHVNGNGEARVNGWYEANSGRSGEFRLKIK
uniref:Uncharacterized protein n=1 Tax=Lotharella oceanica TaxID=641309 RepID=A0A7S2THG9_9EUKA|mmetsp:Transcript_11917/g.22949  ORF Transcript_11917/g.22949 Transcript_11917/m.22949 type:complete len:269 (+) Transcript_11917:73-879(+)